MTAIEQFSHDDLNTLDALLLVREEPELIRARLDDDTIEIEDEEGRTAILIDFGKED